MCASWQSGPFSLAIMCAIWQSGPFSLAIMCAWVQISARAHLMVLSLYSAVQLCNANILGEGKTVIVHLITSGSLVNVKGEVLSV